MDLTLCDQGCVALLQTLTDCRQLVHVPTLSSHVAHCPGCQSLRASVFSRILPDANVPADGLCTVCDADLAAYVDTVLDQGVRTATVAYPQVWWHLWICVGCAEIFAQMMTLAEAKRAGVIPPLPVVRVTTTTTHRVIGHLTVSPQVMARFVQTRAVLGVSYGDETVTVLDEGEDADHSFQLSVQRELDGTWHLLVQVEPPIHGVAVISIGEMIVHATFDPQGVAEITGVSAAVFGDGHSAITVSIEW